ncbi:hypothetical protein [Lactobacillus kefiranofaciens]|uniref:Uncharacterized protein n=1 Tax=Lactobacillus kefiranofaciens TaxID=267818 RepID=A0AAX3UFB9_9LACO|nr:hypothetical protein [Lactobacillus kefiranofaciens]AEG40303.1 Hypothetical protein WANG_0608 [Lactobacillus kefiranofaciens subsp. kefiranofaciens]KRM21638.1 hypothetical protein FC93_GL000429 [Lactobacillus kefiranofaciens subsp. kefiranofaciens DSM 5016 = JCM 6985]MCP9330028.1 hypothetical protein [Lactobacillus kefiranofaciens]QFQ67862.1 hypothetical protein LKK75_05330 [Lactobacillus kefiranofaciens subsp. kefiranofaciens]URW72016.1 hypothetical protein MU859_03715 [Lactobacillus kefir
MLKDQQKFDQLGEKLFMDGVLQDFEKKHGPIKGRMMVTEGKIPPEMLMKLQPELMKNPKWIVVDGSFDFSNYTIGMVVGLNPVRPISNGWLTPQLNHPGVAPTKNWQEFFMEKVMQNIDENGKIDLPLYSLISDKSDLTLNGKEK